MNERGNKEKWMRRRMKTPLINTSEQDVAELLKTPHVRDFCTQAMGLIYSNKEIAKSNLLKMGVKLISTHAFTSSPL